MKLFVITFFSIVFLGVILFSSFSIEQAFAAETKSNNDTPLLDATKCESLISAQQVKDITGLESEDIFFRMITEDLTQLNNPTIISGCAFDFENREGTITIALMVSQYTTSEELVEKIDMALQGVQTLEVTIEEGILGNDWKYFTMEIDDAGLGIMMNTYKENMSVTFNVPLTEGKLQPISVEHLKDMSSIVQTSLESPMIGEDISEEIMITQNENPEEVKEITSTDHPLDFYAKGTITGEHFNGGTIWMAIKGDNMTYIGTWDGSRSKITSTVTQSSECESTFQICLDGKITDDDKSAGLKVGDTYLTKIDTVNKRQIITGTSGFFEDIELVIDFTKIYDKIK